jgi:hypothetical protein
MIRVRMKEMGTPRYGRGEVRRLGADGLPDRRRPHLHPEARDFYRLEVLWKEAPVEAAVS